MLGVFAAGLMATMTLQEIQVGKPSLLWATNTPYAKGAGENDLPTLTAYLPAKPSKTAIVVCPGGGYWMLADHEGSDYAKYLAMHGVTAFVLRYRLGQFGYRHPAMLADAQRAIRTVRSLGYETVGIMGSSAGGHLSGTALVHYGLKAYEASDKIDEQSCKPDFGVLCYAVLSFDKSFGHVGSGDNLLGKEPTEAQMELMDLRRHVTKETPPCFLWHTVEDKGVVIENSLYFAAALRKNEVPFDLHIYQKGNHGIGLQDKAPYANAHPWASDLMFWLKANKWDR
ncbi:MAG TPA: alpha/beta hydrolase [Fimbriimonas sp.]|nr:alpha/beta hydrolase [Fimbriimonas sp.]